ncbi:MAG: hypothetical protein LUG88_03985, partial [Clostridia bacterium]|nr:hypothetical protein [Clostridia bacterium]
MCDIRSVQRRFQFIDLNLTQKYPRTTALSRPQKVRPESNEEKVGLFGSYPFVTQKKMADSKNNCTVKKGQCK